MRAQLTLEPRAASPRRARHFTAGVLTEWGLASDCDNVVESAILLVSELVTNAVLHAHSGVELIIDRPYPVQDATTMGPGERADGVIRIEVRDRSAENPVVRHVGPESTTGRGLALVEALSHRWGVCTSFDGKQVWFELLA